MQELIYFCAFYINTLSLLYSLTLQGGVYSPLPKSTTAMYVCLIKINVVILYIHGHD